MFVKTEAVSESDSLRVDVRLVEKSFVAVSLPEMDQVQAWVQPMKEFAKDSMRLVKRCTKPDRKGNVTELVKSSGQTQCLSCFLEFQKIALATAIGFAIMGFIGFFVKLIHIPINNIIVYA